MQLSKAAAVFFSNFDQIESLGMMVVNDAIDPRDIDNERLNELLEVFAMLESKREETHDRREALCALFGLVGIGSMLQKVIHEVLSNEGEARDG